nr:phosphatase PAP2 family protein [Ancylobacter sp. Lp-2]
MAGSNIPVTVAVVVFAALVLKLLHPLRPCLLPPRFALYFASLYLLGPVLLVNGVLKTFWGRPRPVKVEEFGGSVPFLDAWSLGESFTHRSFASGEAATIACLLPLALFVPRPWRGRVAAMLAMLVALVSLNRVAFGGHFLSDITVAIALVLTIAVALRQVFYVSHAALFEDERLDGELTRLGLAAQTKVRGDLEAMSGFIRGRLARSGGEGRRPVAQSLAVSASILPAE